MYFVIIYDLYIWRNIGGAMLRDIEVLFHILFIFEVLFFNFQNVGNGEKFTFFTTNRFFICGPLLTNH